MDHPFEIGKIYENNKGLYTVLSISPPKMQIQYLKGSKSAINIKIQARIWDRIQTERAIAKEEQQRRKKASRLSITFLGLEEGDFKENVAGTTWRSRQSLGGLVSQHLSDINGNEFHSIAIYRRPQFFVYPPKLPMNNQEEGVKLPKFVVQLNSERLLYGFYIEKSDEPMGSAWYWLRFLNLLSEEVWQENLENIMIERELQWILRLEERNSTSDTYVPSNEIIIPPFAKSPEFSSFSEFVAYLRTLPSQQWCNLFIAKTMAKNEAIELKEKVSQPISHTFNALVPMFLRLLR